MSATSKMHWLKMNRIRLDFPCVPGIIFAILMLILVPFVEKSYAQSDLRVNMPDLCYQCHQSTKDNLSHKYVHFPFKQGMCDNCHYIHASKHEGLIKDDMNALCLSCHDSLKKRIEQSNMHGAIRNGVCTDCHNAHSGSNKDLLVKKEKEICLQCHGRIIEEQSNVPVVHKPFTNGECSACHDSHASREEDLLLASPNTVCKKCHAPRCRVGNVSITSTTKNMNCIKCHAGHGSLAENLLGPKGHSAFLEKNCQQCHNPIVENKKITTLKKGENLCFLCHKKDPAKFSSADVHGMIKENPCTACHDFHAASNENLTVNEATICNTCHGDIDQKIARMEKALKSIRCVPVKDRKCFGCHTPLHSKEPIYLKKEVIATCSECHEAQHRITHPLGNDVIDPRNGEPITCKTCHRMHTAKADFMLAFDRSRELCIQCHKR